MVIFILYLFTYCIAKEASTLSSIFCKISSSSPGPCFTHCYTRNVIIICKIRSNLLPLVRRLILCIYRITPPARMKHFNNTRRSTRANFSFGCTVKQSAIVS